MRGIETWSRSEGGNNIICNNNNNIIRIVAEHDDEAAVVSTRFASMPSYTALRTQTAMIYIYIILYYNIYTHIAPRHERL